MTLDDDFHKRSGELFKIIKESNNEKLKDAYVNFINVILKMIEEERIFLEQERKSNQINYIDLQKYKAEMHDRDVELHNAVMDLSNKYGEQLGKKLTKLQGAILVTPRLVGLGLLLFGKGYALEGMKQTLDKFWNERQNLREDKQ